MSMGRDSLEFAKRLVADNIPKGPTSPTDLPWCPAGVGFMYQWKQSKNMFVARNCSTSLVIEPLITFAWIDILEVYIKARCDIRADEFNFSMESFHKLKQPIATYLSGNMGNWIEGTDASYLPMQ